MFKHGGLVYINFQHLVNYGINMTRYSNAQDIYYKGRETKGRLRDYSWLVIKPNDREIYTFKVTTQTAGAPRRIAQQVYGDHDLYWVLVSFNNRWYKDPGALQVMNWPVAGQVVYYPSRMIILPTLP